MSTWRLLTAELWHRKSNFALSLLAVVAAATMFVAGPALILGYRQESDRQLLAMRQETQRQLEARQLQNDRQLSAMREETDSQLAEMQTQAERDLQELDTRTKRIMRDLGFNLRIVHRNTDTSELLANFVAFDMPEEYVQRLAESPELTKVAHLVARLEQMIQWEGKPRLLVGFAPETVQTHVEKKPPMGFNIELGTVFLGHEAGVGREVGQQVEILGKSFQVARILPPHGNRDEDIALIMHLRDAQEVLEKPGKISEILALGCKCKTVNRVEEISQQLEAVLPEARVMELRLSAIAREDQRKLVEEHHRQRMADHQQRRQEILVRAEADQQQLLADEARDHQRMREAEQAGHAKILAMLGAVNSYFTPLVVLVCAVWVGLLAWSNVRERRTEIGLLRALGRGSLDIARLFLGKAVVLGLLGGLLGCVSGCWLAYWLATRILEVGSGSFVPPYAFLAAALLGGPLVAATASYLPTLKAITQDPAVVLLED
ncbi:MAG: FtsX-like permease family protein [Pirellulaceae bacterium]|nr:FtsX-like permease family protein [Pirellulaceae bacterium]